jgi:hypothetical protein
LKVCIHADETRLGTDLFPLVTDKFFQFELNAAGTGAIEGLLRRHREARRIAAPTVISLVGLRAGFGPGRGRRIGSSTEFQINGRE